MFPVCASVSSFVQQRWLALVYRDAVSSNKSRCHPWRTHRPGHRRSSRNILIFPTFPRGWCPVPIHKRTTSLAQCLKDRSYNYSQRGKGTTNCLEASHGQTGLCVSSLQKALLSVLQAWNLWASSFYNLVFLFIFTFFLNSFPSSGTNWKQFLWSFMYS